MTFFAPFTRIPLIAVVAILGSSIAVLPADTSPSQDPNVGASVAVLPTTGAIIINNAEKLLSEITSFKLKLSADVNVTVDPTTFGSLSQVLDQLSGMLSAQIKELRVLLKENLTQPLSKLGDDVQQSARQLHSAVYRAGLVLERQQEQLIRSAPAILGALQNLTLEARHVVPGRNPAAPRIHFWQFDGVAVPGLIPREGGRLVVNGFNLWRKVAPTVRLLAPDETAIADLRVRPASGPDSFSVQLDPVVLRSYAGKCPLIEVTSSYSTGGLLGVGRKTRKATLHTGLCVPTAMSAQVEVKAGINYTAEGSAEHLGEEKFFRWDNDRCEPDEGFPVSATHEWSIPNSCEITGFTETGKEITETPEIGIKIEKKSRNSIAASGTIDDAACIEIGFVKNLTKVAVWAKSIRPKIRCDTVESFKTEVTGDVVSLDTGSANVCITLPRQKEPKESNYWFTVTPILRGVRAKSYTHPTTSDASTGPVAEGPFIYEARFNPRSGKDESQVCVTVTLR